MDTERQFEGKVRGFMDMCPMASKLKEVAGKPGFRVILLGVLILFFVTFVRKMKARTESAMWEGEQ